jgi:hypothetical protein
VNYTNLCNAFSINLIIIGHMHHFDAEAGVLPISKKDVLHIPGQSMTNKYRQCTFGKEGVHD